MDSMKSDDYIKTLLTDRAKNLEIVMSGEVLFIRAPMQPGVDDAVRHTVEKLNSKASGQNQLIVVLETTGGSIEVVERINDVFRHHFQSVVFVIPNFAYSAGTVLTLSGDEIYMDYYSVLGPIDPQIKTKEGSWVPGLGYLEKYEEIIEKSGNGTATVAEMNYFINRFDPAQLFSLEQAKKHSVDLIAKWLCDYKFKNWEERETTGTAVDEIYKKERAESIASKLGDPKEWNSHGRGIPLRVLESDRIKLRINNFGAEGYEDQNVAIRQYYDLLIDYISKIGVENVIHTKYDLLAF